ncbi:hypothetical protein AB0I84_46285 [Streptomyces spectabilis]|uniref:hypothetical protein n=1 Tax=Streptomyces spectabilis TaxID=68270 RepID=UPI0033D0E196
MPATLAASHPTSEPYTAVSAPVLVSDLSNLERAVALYASDMPTGLLPSSEDHATLHAWIIQGATRLGLEELYRSAAYARGYRLLWLSHLATAEQSRAHELRFPNARRYDQAERLAALFTVTTTLVMSQAAKKRGHSVRVEGACRCGGTGWITVRLDPREPATGTYRNCPAHNPDAVGSLPLAGVAA